MVLAEEDKNRENGSFGPNKLNALYVQVIKRERESESERGNFFDKDKNQL